MIYTKRFLTFSFLTLALVSSASAQPKPALSNGLSKSEVSRLWGEPKEKTEQESHHKEVWRYPDTAKVVFIESKVSNWGFGDANEAIEKPKKKEPVPSKEIKLDPADGDPGTRDLVREIAREIPSGPDSPASNEPPPPAAIPGQNMAGQIVQPPFMPQQGVPQFPPLGQQQPGPLIVDDE